MGPPIYKALALDAYGTIVQTRLKLYPFRNFEDATGIKITHNDWEQHNYPSMRDLARGIGVQGHEEAIRKLEEESRAEAGAVVKFSDTDEAIERAREYGLKLAIISNAGNFFIDPLQRLGLIGRVDVTIHACMIGHTKPSREIYEEASRRLRIDPREIFMVGDHLIKDAQAARAVGMGAAWLNRKNKPGDFSPQIHGLMEVFPLLGYS